MTREMLVSMWNKAESLEPETGGQIWSYYQAPAAHLHLHTTSGITAEPLGIKPTNTAMCLWAQLAF